MSGKGDLTLIAYFFERTIKTVDKKILSDIIKVQFKRSRNIGDGETSSVRIRTSREGVLRLEDTVVTGGRRNRFALYDNINLKSGQNRI